ncbi:c-type cytochrome [Oricola thermophila]|uniref:Cytochrome c family protein n=1 Tax=Oricola thermophila TaxID=2742145 RepID=A0A6N1VES6_9HYPH|nr:cytochrome c family protein [Oricola thermophila]QKV19456.1 cytochrome c family protein [Oricola thermophila]
MSSSNLNTYAGTLLGGVFIMMTVGILGEAIFHTETPEQAGFAIVVDESAGSDTGVAEAPEVELIAPLLASADVDKGASVFKKCQACHTTEEGGANKVGPNLWDIVNRPVAAHEGFKYSGAMTEFAANGAVWDYEHLNEFIKKPKNLVPGTAMGFAGLSKIDDRANLIAYLRTMSANPAPLPDPNAAPADEAASAEGAAE